MAFGRAIPVWAAMRLVGFGALTADEDQLLRGIAAGTAVHPRIPAERARELVQDIDSEDGPNDA
ncbi:hypothetical protein [Actinacidiphila oryziradicis]|uniref:Uncharacterized protein n=1 Tax=Actinacidiphila oryziradicis TaxID=2571141 RepID=A0A4U0SMA8_9ACTN|nr:hypothetical protein [Actinacidiphila oryziradicis]TKA10806.1 hypothetical protein FCI23_14335 [Actinacidiphila oryziradicis]